MPRTRHAREPIVNLTNFTKESERAKNGQGVQMWCARVRLVLAPHSWVGARGPGRSAMPLAKAASEWFGAGRFASPPPPPHPPSLGGVTWGARACCAAWPARCATFLRKPWSGRSTGFGQLGARTSIAIGRERVRPRGPDLRPRMPEGTHQPAGKRVFLPPERCGSGSGFAFRRGFGSAGPNPA